MRCHECTITITRPLYPRIGPGLYIGGGAQYGIALDKDIYNNIAYSGGIGADYAVGMEGAGAQALINADGVNISVDARVPYSSYGIGASAGCDACYTHNF